MAQRLRDRLAAMTPEELAAALIATRIGDETYRAEALARIEGSQFETWAMLDDDEDNEDDTPIEL